MTKQPKKILLVDDNPDILEAVQLLLEDAGYLVVTDNGERVEHLSEPDLPDIILMDMLLSGKDGRDVIKFLKSQNHTKKIPVILNSAHPQAKKLWKGSLADDFIAKPFDIDDLLVLIQKHLKKTT
jgi:CheY-like chemotaxis protein